MNGCLLLARGYSPVEARHVLAALLRDQPVILPPGMTVEMIRPRCARVLHQSAVGDEFDELYFDEGVPG